MSLTFDDAFASIEQLMTKKERFAVLTEARQKGDKAGIALLKCFTPREKNATLRKQLEALMGVDNTKPRMVLAKDLEAHRAQQKEAREAEQKRKAEQKQAASLALNRRVIHRDDLLKYINEVSDMKVMPDGSVRITGARMVDL